MQLNRNFIFIPFHLFIPLLTVFAQNFWEGLIVLTFGKNPKLGTVIPSQLLSVGGVICSTECPVISSAASMACKINNTSIIYNHTKIVL